MISSVNKMSQIFTFIVAAILFFGKVINSHENSDMKTFNLRRNQSLQNGNMELATFTLIISSIQQANKPQIVVAENFQNIIHDVTENYLTNYFRSELEDNGVYVQRVELETRAYSIVNDSLIFGTVDVMVTFDGDLYYSSNNVQLYENIDEIHLKAFTSTSSSAKNKFFSYLEGSTDSLLQNLDDVRVTLQPKIREAESDVLNVQSPYTDESPDTIKNQFSFHRKLIYVMISIGAAFFIITVVTLVSCANRNERIRKRLRARNATNGRLMSPGGNSNSMMDDIEIADDASSKYTPSFCSFAYSDHQPQSKGYSTDYQQNDSFDEDQHADMNKTKDKYEDKKREKSDVKAIEVVVSKSNSNNRRSARYDSSNNISNALDTSIDTNSSFDNSDLGGDPVMQSSIDDIVKREERRKQLNRANSKNFSIIRIDSKRIRKRSFSEDEALDTLNTDIENHSIVDNASVMTEESDLIAQLRKFDKKPSI